MKARQEAARKLVEEKICLRKEGRPQSGGGSTESASLATFTYQSRKGLAARPAKPHRGIFGPAAKNVVVGQNPVFFDEDIPSMRPSAQARHESLHRMQKRRHERANEDAQERDKVLNSLFNGSEPVAFEDALAAMNARLMAQNVSVVLEEACPGNSARKNVAQPQEMNQSFKPLQETCDAPKPQHPLSAPKAPSEPPPQRTGRNHRPWPATISQDNNAKQSGGFNAKQSGGCTSEIEQHSAAIQVLERLKGDEPEEYEDRKALAVLYVKRAVAALQIVRRKIQPGEPLPAELRPHVMRANMDAANAAELDEGNAGAWLRKGQALLTMSALPHRAKEAKFALERARDCPNLPTNLKNEVAQWLEYAKTSFDAQTPMPEGCAQM